MKVVIAIPLIFLGLKLISNLGVPYELLRTAKLDGFDRRSGISLMPEVEVFLLGVGLFLSLFSSGDAFFTKPLFLMVWGGLAIVFSYVHMFLVMMIGGWMITRNSKK